MSLNDPMDCIGCEACSKVCPKDCHTHSPEPMAA
jgi:formate hydrogenlyase subunit 6/NADH:ubiquinone oxidoreductase subunit I